jgi:predicted nucleic acid-binding Zn finger protein
MKEYSYSREELIEKFSHDSSMNPKLLERAIDVVIGGRVKRHVFIPSGRVLYTVVGRKGDEFVDPDKPFCSCQHFFYSVLGGRDETCYHLLASSIATETDSLAQTVFHDEEFKYFLELLTLDLISRSGEKGDKDDVEQPNVGPRGSSAKA